MRVVVNARFLLPHHPEGLGRFSHEVTRRLVEQHPEVEFHLLFDRKPHPRFVYGPNVVPHVLGPQARHPVLYVAWFEWSVSWALARLRPQAFFSPDGFLSLSAPESIPQFPVLHDLAFEHVRGEIGGLARRYYRHFMPRFARRARQVLTVSETTRQDIVQTYGLDPRRITVVGNGSSGHFSPHSPEVNLDTRERFSQGEPYFLYVGAVQPRKNLVRVLRAFDAFKTQTGLPHRLLLAGRLAWNYGSILHTHEAMQHRQHVQLLGFVPDADLARLYSAAQAVVYVSLFEGFGLPVLEAMHAEAPVISSRGTSMEEVAGPAALLVDPTRDDELAAALVRLATDPALARQLVEAGRLRRTHYSWEATARAVWQAMEAGCEPERPA